VGAPKWLLDFLDGHNGAVTALATLVVAVFTWRLFVATEKLWNSGENELKHAQVVSATQFRAYVGVSDSKLVGSSKVKAQITLKNFGHTPASNVVHLCQIGLDAFPGSTNTGANIAEDDELEGRKVLFPGSHYQYESKQLPVGTTDWTALGVETKAIYVRGTVTYIDHTKSRRITRYSLYFKGTSNQSGTLELVALPTGNSVT